MNAGAPLLTVFFYRRLLRRVRRCLVLKLVLRTLPRALRWAAFQRSQPEVRRGSQAALRVAVWPSKSRGSLDRSPAAPGGVAATHGCVDRCCLLVSYL